MNFVAVAWFLCTSSYRGTSLIRNTSLLGPYRRTMSRVIWWP